MHFCCLCPETPSVTVMVSLFYFNCVMYHLRNDKRRRKCSKANEVLSLQRILPSVQKRKMKILELATAPESLQCGLGYDDSRAILNETHKGSI